MLVRRDAVVGPMAVKCCWKQFLSCGSMSPIAVIGHRSAAGALPQNCAAGSAGGVKGGGGGGRYGRQYRAVDKEAVLVRARHKRHEVPTIAETADVPLCFAVARLERLERRAVGRAVIAEMAELRACPGALTSCDMRGVHVVLEVQDADVVDLASWLTPRAGHQIKLPSKLEGAPLPLCAVVERRPPVPTQFER